MKRRTFLVGAAAAAGALVVGYRLRLSSLDAQAAALVAGSGESLLGGWVKIAGDDTVTVYVPHADMGQGVHTALAMLLADELDADWSKVFAEQAPADRIFANRFLAKGWILQGWKVPSILDGAVDTVFGEAARYIGLQLTGGSTAVRFTGQVGMRIVGAAAREMLVEETAARWSVPIAELTAKASVITHTPSGRTIRYGELAEAAARRGVPASPRLKAREARTIVGTPVPRLDIPAKVTGACRYGIDVRLPGMRYAAVRSAPVHGGSLVSVDPAPALSAPGVEQVVRLPDAVAVIGRSYWQAEKALAALKPVFSDGGKGNVSTASLFEQQRRALDSGEGDKRFEVGDASVVMKSTPADRIVEATYQVPYLHHAPMEPINATAHLKDGSLTAWSGEQEPLPTKQELARLAGLNEDRVTFIGQPLGGSFGRRSIRTSHAAYYLAQLVEIAKAASPSPVQMIWSREQDFAQGSYRPQLMTRVRASLGPDGRPTAWTQVFVDQKVRLPGFAIPYQIPNQLIRSVEVPTHMRIGSWRSVAHTQHGFWTEVFIDELAHRAGRDPFEYRRDLLPLGSREQRVLETAAQRAGWGSPLPPGSGRGIALVESFGSIVAEVVEVTVGADRSIRVNRVVAAVDCGDLCHPDTATQQVEGAIVMGLSAALAEKITLERGAVVERNFDDYRLLALAQTPAIEVHFLSSDGPWGGLGEPGVPPVAPALANAVFAASGVRARSLPLMNALAA